MHLVRLCLAVFLLVAGIAQASPLSPINLHHTSWTAKDGAPPSIIAVAQTPDRWLWLASLNGVYRFDGVKFERFQPPGEQRLGNDIWGMRVLKSGALWIGYRSGGASVWHKGVLRSFGKDDGFPVASVLDFEEDWKGRVWASTSLGFRVYDGSQWRTPDESKSGRTGQCFLQTDSAQTMWARCEQGIYSLPKNAESLGEIQDRIGFGRLTIAPDHTVWTMGGKPGELLALAGPGKERPAPHWPRARESGGTMMFERDGVHAWVTRANGVMRIGPGESGQAFGIPNGLSGNMPNGVFQDAEGNIWVGTESGLDRFRAPALSGITLPPIYWDAVAIAAGDDGALWLGGHEIRKPGFEAFANLSPQTTDNAVSVVYKQGADVWTGGREGLLHYRDGKREKIALPDYLATMQFHTIARDNEGGLWTAIRNTGVIRLKDGVWQRGGGYKDLEKRASWILPDKRGRIWFGYMDNSLRLLENGKVSTYGAEQGLSIGTVEHIVESDSGIWIGGLNGLYHFDGHRFVQVQVQGEDPLLGVSGIVPYGDALWLNGSAGITVITLRELEKAVANPHYRAGFKRYDHKDGLRGVATTAFPLPSAVAGSDGKLWFATTAGLFWLDTKSGATNRLAPPVLIRSVNVDGVTVPLSRDTLARLPAGAGRLQVDFTALSYTMPERMQFQYQLDGVDRGWQQGDAARNATYTDLPPGRYRFRVRASNNDGVWSESDAVAEFMIEPAFYQTMWFRVLCALLLALGLWIAYKLRVAQVARQVSGRFEARLQERERIARDLHDTLLQTVQALLLQMQCAWHKLPPDAPVRRDIERSLDLAQAALEEGRDKVQGLRVAPVSDLLTEVCRVMKAEHPEVALECRSAGVVRPLAPAVSEELRCIALEALRNAARHAQAKQICIEIGYWGDSLTIEVRDDGRGMPGEVLLKGRGERRWGLVGMRERAERVGAQLDIASEPGEGTIITVDVPGKVAYCPLAA